jgi:hypothetical protein
MNLNVLNTCYNGIDNTIYVINCVDICWTLRKTFPIFWMRICASNLFSLQLIIIFLNSFVTILLNKMCNN